MTRVRVEIEGSHNEVFRVLRQLGSAERRATVGDAGGSIETPAAGTQDAAVPHEAVPGEWTEGLASDFLAGLEPAARRMALHVWRAGTAGIHRSALCQRTELTPMELRSLLMRMGHALRRFQRERGMTLSRPVAANSPLQSYFVDLDFAAVANPKMFSERMPRQLADGEGCP